MIAASESAIGVVRSSSTSTVDHEDAPFATTMSTALSPLKARFAGATGAALAETSGAALAARSTVAIGAGAALEPQPVASAAAATIRMRPPFALSARSDCPGPSATR